MGYKCNFYTVSASKPLILKVKSFFLPPGELLSVGPLHCQINHLALREDEDEIWIPNTPASVKQA